MKEERAAKAIEELNNQLKVAYEDKKDIEIEFVALKKNFLNLQEDLDREKARSESLNLELIQLVNENRVLQQDTHHTTKKAGEIGDHMAKAERKNEKMSRELQETKEALLAAKGEVERLKTELIKYDLT